MSLITITDITGSLPINVYVADYYGNNRSYLGQITGYSSTEFFLSATTYNNVPLVSAILIDSDGCERVEKIVCTT